jgi:hypothetical protein
MKFGLEIEGFAEETDLEETIRPICEEIGYSVGSDGSIDVDTEMDCPRDFEIRTKVYDKTELEDCLSSIAKFYKYVYVNNSCGLHIHISFDNMKNYYRLLSWDFVKRFQEAYKAKFTENYEQSRIKSEYCKFYKDESIFCEKSKEQTRNILKGSYRRYAVNFNSFNIVKTIEFRIFPAARSMEKLRSYVEFLLEFVSKYCNKRTREKQITSKGTIRTFKPKVIELCVV